jgi:chromosome partitioning protein
VAGVTRIITVANQKGGVGKTTSTVNIAAAIGQTGHSVLVIDMDPQGNASTALGVTHHEGTPSVYEVLSGELTLVDVIQECPDIPGLWTAPATIDLAGAEIELVAQVAREYRLARAIDALLADRHFDYVFLDCPPSLGLLTLNGLVAAREVLLPIQCEYYALEGLAQLLRNVDLVKRNLNPRLEVSTIVCVMYDARTKLADQVVKEVRGHFGDKVCRSVVPRSVRLSEAPSHGQPIITFDPGSRGATAYRGVAKEVSGGPAERTR